MNKRSTGADYEEFAAAWLQSKGFQILKRNFRSRYGEIDMIAREGDELVFLEVKYRRNSSYGTSFDAVDFRKQQRICRMADWYRCRYHVPTDTPCRFDVVAVDGDTIRLMRNAFDYIPPWGGAI